MAPLWTCTRLTVREAWRSRLLGLAFGLTLVYIGLVGWGVRFIADHASNPVEAVTTGAGLELLAFFFGSFMLVLLAVFVAGQSLRHECDNGLLQAVLTKPVSRLAVVAGRWLGATLVLLVWVAVFTAGVIWAVDLAVGFYPPHPVQAAAMLLLEALAILGLRLLFGSFLGTLVSGIAPLMMWGVARVGGLVETVGAVLHLSGLVTAGIVTSLIVPTDVLARASTYYLLPDLLTLGGGDVAMAASSGNPFVSTSPPAMPMLVWAVLYAAGAVALGAWIFSRRDV